MWELLNPLPKIRHSFCQLTMAISRKSESAAEALYQWARKHRDQADQESMHCAEFYSLIEHLIQPSLKHPSPEQVNPPPASDHFHTNP